MTSQDVKQRAGELGFDLCGVARAASYPELTFLNEWLGRGYHGTMAYMARNAEKRLDVRLVLPSARSVVVLGTIYNTGAPSSLEQADPRAAVISRYAWGDDYHDVVGHRLAELERWMRKRAGEGFEARRYVDTGPVLERVFAQHAGLGWIGQNTCLINPGLGSWLFLAEIICNAELAADDEPIVDHCGTCRLCIESCPTGALVGDRVLDSTRCISYLTIELKEIVPEALREGIGRHIYGCDICQEVCPWNADAAAARSGDPAWQPRAAFTDTDLLKLWRMSDDELKTAIKGTPMTRVRVKRLRRNLAIAIGNCSDPGAVHVFDEPVDAPSVLDPLVQEHIEWARARARSTDRQT
ncbi:MAG: tRNA epoxyqueuosine(34) reductase QueG [Acidobacteriota bacterium]